MLELWEGVAAQLDIKVTYEPLQLAGTTMRGGLCRVKGEYRIIVDKRATAEERVTTLATALARRTSAMRAEGKEPVLSPKVQKLLHMHDAAPRGRAA